jgi:hypothetical protein
MRKTISILTLAALAAVVPAQVQARAACAARWPVRWRAIMPVIMPWWGLWAAVSPRAPITSTRQPRPRSGILRPRLHPSVIDPCGASGGRARRSIPILRDRHLIRLRHVVVVWASSRQ